MADSGFSVSRDAVKKHKASNQVDAYATADNALATATLAAPGAGWRNSILRVDASFNDVTINKTLTVKSGTTTIFVRDCIGSVSIDFDKDCGKPAINPNEAMSAELAASGTAGKVGRVYLQGFKVREGV